MYRAHLALQAMALRAGNATEAAACGASAARIRAASQQLWVVEAGLPASHREEGGHRRLRPDPWLYSIFLPIEAGLWDAATAAQALFFSEYGLERDGVLCDAGGNSSTCGEVVWTSNWVPSQWSVRQLWSGDNYGLALAYFLAGLPDEGFTVLSGTLRRDMLQSVVPGQSGGTNGGTDFNDCVHPLTRALIEGLWGWRPDLPAGTVEVAPQLPSDWRAASFSGAFFSLQFSSDLASTTSLSVQLAQPVPVLLLRLPLRAGALGAVRVTGVPPDATVSNSTLAGVGQSEVLVRIEAAPGGALIGAAAASLTFAGALPCAPSVHAAGAAGATLTLAAPPGLALVGFEDPQGVFGGSAGLAGGQLSGTVARGLSGGSHMVIGHAATAAGGLPQTILFKLSVSSAAPPRAAAPPPPHESAGASWTYVPLGGAANADQRDIFKEGKYTSPRPETCAVRLGSDGWSAWTFPYWDGPWAPQADFANVPALTVAPGVIQTPQGAQFALASLVPAGAPNIAFVSLWDAYPNTTRVPVQGGAGATGVWVLLAGSTNPMQTRLANGALRLVLSDGSVDTLELTPPSTTGR